MKNYNVQVDSRLVSIWERIKSNPELSSLPLEYIEDLATEKQLVVNEIKEVTFGKFITVPGIHLDTSAGKVIYPKVRADSLDIYTLNIEPKKEVADFWTSVDWFVPAYVSNETLHNALDTAGVELRNFRQRPDNHNQKQFDYALPSIYSVGQMVLVVNQMLPRSDIIKKHLPIIKESILAFYSGMRVAAIASLIPIMEDILRSLVIEDEQSDNLIININKCIDAACMNAFKMDVDYVDWVPNEFATDLFLKSTNERVFILESIRSWLLNSFYVDSKKYNKESGFNRHHFAHALSDIWHRNTNFFRAIGLIQALAFIECFARSDSKISVLLPEPNEATKSFHIEIIASTQIQMQKALFINKIQSENALPYNVTASDDGWLLRSGILSDLMDKEIIKSLRNNGWQCGDFIDPIKDGEYITVSASKNGKIIKVALLYSCASSRQLYEKLSVDCDAILFHGAAYHMKEYAGTIENVYPLNAWLVPI
ncbi:hypothetical protein GJV09_01980 [Enterobacteriaceae bacterium RIT702]|nr:hypothetical protein [Enterobacteriaceae bacterium RIT702]